MFIRFGEIPENERSGIFRGEDSIGEEIGVSVYDANIDEVGNVSVGIPLPLTKSTLDTFIGFVEYQNRKCYLVDGEVVGRGADGEPLIQNVKVIKEITYRTKTKENE